NPVAEKIDFSEYFGIFWDKKNKPLINYSPYGSSLIADKDPEKLNQQSTSKNSPNFYRQAPFLTIAKELLKLVKEDKVEKLIFLSAYDKRKFPTGDPRKKAIFSATFDKFANCSLELIGFDSESQGANKAD
ncbi:18299_t:CDS:1, partial [Funneliformis geosporum]